MNKRIINGIRIFLMTATFVMVIFLTSKYNTDNFTKWSGKPPDIYDSPYYVESQVCDIFYDSNCYGYESGGDYSLNMNLKEYDQNNPLLYIYIHPQANEERLEDVAQTIHRIDDIFSRSKDYKNYCAENGVPYFVRFKCLDETVLDMELTGDLTVKEIKNSLTGNLPKFKEKYEANKEDFKLVLDDCKGLQKDTDGNYYIIFDSSDCDNSVKAISETIDSVNKYDFVSESYISQYNDDLESLGFLDYGYTIYFDKYGEKNELYTNSFCGSSKYFYHAILDTLLWKDYFGTAPEDIPFEYYYVSLNQNKDISPQIELRLRCDFEGEYDRETIVRYGYDLFCEVQRFSAEHNMTYINKVTISADFKTSSDGYMFLGADFEIPLDEVLTFEEFNQLFDEYGFEGDSRDYEEG